MRALITAGGTSEPIDDVRVVTNLSTGRFGAAIANALSRRGVEVTILAGPALLAREHLLDAEVRCVPFGPDGSFADLDRALTEHTEHPPDLLFMAAAVSDYSPVRAAGKIRSTEDRLVVEMTKNPKLLKTLRERCGPDCWLVGFKLLSGVSTDELVEVARGQIAGSRLDMTVANDAATFAPGRHPIVVVGADGRVSEHAGSKEQMAEVVADAALAGWFERHGAPPPAQQAFPGSAVWPDDAVPEWVAGHARALDWARALYVPEAWRCFGGVNDSGEVADLVSGMRRVDERPERIALDAATHGRLRNHAFAWGGESGPSLFPIRGAFLIEDPGPVLVQAWQDIAAGFTSWVTERVPVLSVAPVVIGPRLVGLMATVDADGPATTGFIAPRCRNHGHADDLARVLALREDTRVWAPDDRAKQFWVARGFIADGPDTLVRHPHLRPAASVALVHARAREVLLGKRLVGAYPDHWAFPGGGVEDDESAKDAAARELEEETGVVLPYGHWSLKTPLTVGDGERAWKLDNFAYLTLERPEPRITDELDARWVPLEAALELEPMASGTRTVLRRIRQRLLLA